MILTSRADLNVSLAQIYAELTDMAALERSALRRGVELTHLDGPRGIEAGARWRVAFRFRGKLRKAEVEITQADSDGKLEATSVSAGLKVHSSLDLIRLTPSETRMAMKTKLKPTTLSARLLVQSLKLTRAPVERKLDARYGEFAQTMATRAASRSI